MKTVFNFGLCAVAAVLLAAGPARAETFWTTRDLLGDASFFRGSERVGYKQFEPSAEQRARIEARLGYALPRARYTIFVATTGGHVDGYAVIDDENGQHLPITFAVKVSPAGVVERQEIVAYREARGDEVRDERFRKQFVGKRAEDAVRAGQDIAIVSGATISSRAMAVGVKRALVLVEELILKPAQVASARAQR
jgi:electron transport complex protein RnfG